MGDRSPKSNKKLAGQKQDKSDQQTKDKRAEVVAGQAWKEKAAKSGKK